MKALLSFFKLRFLFSICALCSMTVHAQSSWQQAFDLQPNEKSTGLVQTPDGGFLILNHKINGEIGYSLLRLDQQGDSIWYQSFSLPCETSISVDQIILSDAQEIIVASHCSNGFSDNMLLRAHAPNGAVAWESTIPSVGDRILVPFSILKNPTGGYIIGGSAIFITDNTHFGFLMLVTEEGIPVWTTYSAEAATFAFSAKVIETQMGNYLLFHDTSEDFTYMKVSPFGELLYSQTFLASELAGDGIQDITSAYQDGALLLERDEIIHIQSNNTASNQQISNFVKGKRIIQNQTGSYYIADDHHFSKIDPSTNGPVADILWQLDLNTLQQQQFQQEEADINLYFDPGIQQTEQGEEICVSVKAEDFSDILGFQFSLSYDPTALEFVSVGNFQVPGLSANLIGIPSDGTSPGAITVIWIDNALGGISLPNGTPLFDVCFDVIGEEGVTYMDFSNQPSTIQILDNNDDALMPSLGQAKIIIGEFPEQPFGEIVSVINTLDNGFALLFDDFENKQTRLMRLPSDINGSANSSISGHLFIDENTNCIKEDSENTVWQGWLVTLQDVSGNTVYTTTDSDGFYSFALDSLGEYLLSASPPHHSWSDCPTQNILIDQIHTDTIYDLGFSYEENCAMLEVTSALPNIRPCMNSNASLHFQNIGNIPSENTLIEIQLAPFFNLESASLPFTGLGNDLFQFDLGDLDPGQMGMIYLNIFVDCEAEIGATQCLNSFIFSDNDCNSLYNGALLTLEVNCTEEEVNFRIINEGDGDMSSPSNYLVIEDNIILMNGQVQLQAGQEELVSLEVQGDATYRMEAQQDETFPDFYGTTTTAIAVENCKGLHEGLINAFPAFDESPFYDSNCRPITASYDPNDKLALPTGLYEQHFIPEITLLSYTIRFQNTGTDTAFNVIIYDELSEFLDISSFRPGAASHPYTFDIFEDGTAKFTFANILLPDSTTNEQASQGFVTFEITTATDTPIETNIFNQAAIYFDFNEAIITNQTFHTIGHEYLENLAVSTEFIADLSNITVKPNPFQEFIQVQIDWEPQNCQLLIYSPDGQLQMQTTIQRKQQSIFLSSLPSGLYFFKIKADNQLRASGKILKME